MIKSLSVATNRQGLHEITRDIQAIIQDSELQHGLCSLFIQHTSASLIIQENADPAARNDLEHWLNRFVTEDDPLYTHVSEGPDDMPSHIKSTLTATSVSIPIVNNKLALGTWQGVFLWEHRRSGADRRVIVHVGE